MSQPVSLSAQARYVTCPTWNMSITICWNGHSGDGVMVMGSRGWLGAMVVQNEQFALKFRIEAFIPANKRSHSLELSFHLRLGGLSVGSAISSFLGAVVLQFFCPLILALCHC